jgi:hypothetical protein
MASLLIWAERETHFTHFSLSIRKTLHDYPPISPGNAWSRPQNFATTQLPLLLLLLLLPLLLLLLLLHV